MDTQPGTLSQTPTNAGPGPTASPRDAAAPPTPTCRPNAVGGANRTPDLQRVLGLAVPVSVTLAQRRMPVEAILRINVGTIIEFDVPFDSQLALEVADRPIGEGHAVKVGENFGLRLSRIGSVRDRINAMCKV